MIFVFILLGIIIFLCIYFLLILFSTIKIRLINLKFNNILQYKLQYEYKIHIEIYFFNKIKILGIHLNQNSKLFKKAKLPSISTDIKYSNFIFKVLKKLHLQVEEFYMKFYLGTENTFFTNSLVLFLSIIVSIILPHIVETKDYNKIFYQILPIQNGKNCLDFKLNSIISIKMVHIINIIYIYLQEKGGDKNGRASNRRFNDNSNEQYSRHGRCKYNYRRAN